MTSREVIGITYKLRPQEHSLDVLHTITHGLKCINIMELEYSYVFSLAMPRGYGIFISQSGIEPVSPALQSLNHWTTREVLNTCS